MQLALLISLMLSLLFAHQGDAFMTSYPSSRYQRHAFTTDSYTRSEWDIHMSNLFHTDEDEDIDQPPRKGEKRNKIRQKVSEITKRIVARPNPKAIAEVMSDATYGAVDLAIDEVAKKSNLRQSLSYEDIIEKEAAMESETIMALDTIVLAKTTAGDAFAMAEAAIEETEEALRRSKEALAACKADVAEAIAIAEKAALQASISSQKATVLAARAAISASSSDGVSISTTTTSKSSAIAETADDMEENDITESSESVVDMEEQIVQDTEVLEEEEEEETEEELIEAAALAYEDVDYHLSEMSPPFIGEDQCLVPGEAVVRVEKAMDNSRRIFAGIDILASVDDVWELLTDYDNLQKVVPNLVVNDVVERYDGEDVSQADYNINPGMKSEEQCQILSQKMKGSKLKQVGGAKVIGINFSAQVTLEVREWPKGMPDFFHFSDDEYEGQSRGERANLERKRKLERYHFPRPFAISKLPTKDISMQSVEKDDGEFRLYQGVWRMQPLPGCAPEGGSAMRLTYAVEISPRPYLPVALVEGRISNDLCNNLLCIRNAVSSQR